MRRKDINRLNRKKLIILLVVFFIIAEILEAVISFYVLRLDISESTSLLLNQIESKIESNETAEEIQLVGLKETYMISAKAAAYIITAKSEVIVDVDELKNIAGLLGVDEIHIFDESGTIISGTNPEYYGYNFDSGEQMAYFKPMLTDKQLSMCQDVTPNTAEGKSMMYAITWDSNGDHMVQVGVEPSRLLEMLQDHSIENVINSIPLTDGYAIYALETANGQIVASTNEGLVGVKYSDYIDVTISEENAGKGRIRVLGKELYYMSYEMVDNYVIAISYRIKSSINTMAVPLQVICIYLLAACLAIFWIFTKEEKMFFKSNTDELTGLYNRRAYEDKIQEIDEAGIPDDFVYVSIDINGLKVVNDTIGHSAGDELIIGAGNCLKQCLEPYGDVYRTGGDEFIALLNVSQEELNDIFERLDLATGKWSGKDVKSLSLSYGYASKAQNPDTAIREIAILADKKMYEAKSRHYRAKGVDRRGQKDAHIALCSLYTKILKINLTEDSYQIVNMDAAEKTEEKGFDEKISVWLRKFGETGQVHPEDLKGYLEKTDIAFMEDYFASGKTSLHIFYRRKCGDDFKQVMMEIIPANDYNADSHTYYLYVKNIDK